MITWISVKDRLPAPHEKVLTLAKAPEVPHDTIDPPLDRMSIDWLEPGYMGYGPTGLAFAENCGPITHWAPISELGVP